jgi:KaiC/GvpD/RAD55 family RecA-like ATPase
VAQEPEPLPDQVLTTRIAEAYWCDPAAGYSFKPAKLSIARRPREHLSWLDELFHGGVAIPQRHDGRARSFVISGPPGSGKSTLALEMVYRWAMNHGLRTTYLLTEAHAEWVRKNVRSFGWPGSDEIFQLLNDGVRPPHGTRGSVVITDGIQNLRGYLGSGTLRSVLDFFGVTPVSAGADPIRTEDVVPDVLVVDSLNTVDQPTRTAVYAKLGHLISSGVRLVLMIGDSSLQGPLTEPWEFAADVVLKLDGYYNRAGYLVRSIEILKARYQSHVWGRHQLKLYEMPKSDSAQDERLKLRQHPYISQGGVFIYPSIHYVLSRYKTMSPVTQDDSAYLPAARPELTRLLGGKGFPKGRCTALVGGRGTHKSHLGYLQVLHGVMQKPKEGEVRHKALIVSLRDDEGTTRGTLSKILADLGSERDAGEVEVDRLVERGDLEITYYPPGFITPEEFFHRLILSINRLKAGDPSIHVSVLFNSLDQLRSRFPLCAEHAIFVPGIIHMLTAESITSYFVAASTDEDGGDHGLLSMAELILETERIAMAKDQYLALLRRAVPQDESVWKAIDEYLGERVSVVTLSVERFAGGDPAGAQGVLELLQGELARLVGRDGMLFMPMSQRAGEAASV